MKDQYFGDLNDYRKYGLIRELGRAGLRTLVCWLLTQNDGRSDGSKTGYLDQPARFRRYDPEVFDLLRAAVRAGRRSVSVVEGSPLFPGCGYHSEVLHPGLELRAGYFETLYAAATGHDVVLLDPDNGLQVRSVRKGSKQGPKYVFRDEVEALSSRGHSVVVFQYLPRVQRLPYLRSRAAELVAWTGACTIPTLLGSEVAYFTVPQPRHLEVIVDRLDAFVTSWSPAFERVDL